MSVNRYINWILVTLTLMIVGCNEEPRSHLPVFTTRQGQAEWPSIESLRNNAAPKPAHFELTDQNGQLLSENSLNSHIIVANFFFTQCRNQCPQLTAGMKRLQQTFIQTDNVLLLSHSVATGMDNTTTLHAFAEINDINAKVWRLLSGNGSVIDRLASDVYLLPDINEGRDRLVHSELFVLLDKKQRVRGFYNGSLPLEIDNLINDIHILQHEQTLW